MTKRRTAIAAASALVLAAGSAGAIAATSQDEGKKREDAVLSDAAKRLNVTPEKLRDALGDAQDAQLDQAVEDGELTKEQADAIKQRRQQSGRVLGLGPGKRGGPGFGPHGPHGGPGFGPPGEGFGMRGAAGDVMAEVAKALGISRDRLHDQLHDGKSVADIARAQGKDLDDVKAAARAAVVEELGEAVKAGKLTDAQRDRLVEHLDEHLDRLAEGRMGMGRGFRHGGPPPGP